MEPKSFIQSYKIRRLVKALAKPRPGQNLTLAQNRSSGSATSAKPRADAFPVGTERNGRRKVSMSPAKWVSVSSGHSFDSHDAPHDQHHKVDDHKDLVSKRSQIIDSIKHTMRSDDLVHAEKLVTKFIQEHMHYHNMFGVTNQVASQSGEVPKDHQSTTYGIGDKSKKYKEDFVQFVSKAQKRTRMSKK